jgi:hypothetical protein
MNKFSSYILKKRLNIHSIYFSLMKKTLRSCFSSNYAREICLIIQYIRWRYLCDDQYDYCVVYTRLCSVFILEIKRVMFHEYRLTLSVFVQLTVSFFWTDNRTDCSSLYYNRLHYAHRRYQYVYEWFHS